MLSNVDLGDPHLFTQQPPTSTQVTPVITRLVADVDDPAGVDHVEWWLDGVQLGTGTSLPWSGSYPNGKVIVEIRAWDKLGQETTAGWYVYIDNTDPTVDSLTPANGQLLRGKSFTTKIAASDADSVDVSTRLVGGCTCTSATVRTGKDGTQTVTWQVTDAAGNVRTVKRTVIVDNTKPTLKVTKGPKNGAKVSGTVKVVAAAKDKNSIAKVQLLINGKVVATDARAGYAFSINTKKYGKKFTVKLRAYDKAGNVTVSSTRTWHR
ncbi:Ig-like domain-containing protein [Actinoplanes sp. NPDC051851]|uniref:Ig-like domain-containing protein n=1 Tax=Actinoplanes sp. NPDC051851 TaxID=3154753 RepID=UPI00343EFB6B